MQFQIGTFWEDEELHVYREFCDLKEQAQAKSLKRLKEMEKKTVIQLFKSNELEKVHTGPPALYELKLKISPPVRMLGILNGNIFTPLHIFTKKRKKLSQTDIQTASNRIDS